MRPGIIRAFRWLPLLIAAGGGAYGSSAAPAQAVPETPAVTYNRDVAPILFDHCASCHRPGQAAPFPLLTYGDAFDHGPAIAEATRRRSMPRWLAEPGDFEILGERRLTEAEIDTIDRWVRDGMAEGDAADRSDPPSFPDGWELGEPDLVLTADPPYALEPGTADTFRHLVIPTGLESDVFVRAVEFRTEGAPIHHSVIRLDRTSGSRRRDGRDGRAGFDAMSWDGDIQDPEGQFLGWAPGRGPIVSPAGMPWRLERGADLVVEVHLPPSDRPVPVGPTIGLFLSETPAARTPLRLTMESKSIDIPPGEADYVVVETYELPVPVDLLSVFPHAHHLGKEMRITAAPPDGAVRTLLHIPRWDFRWQRDYRYAAPIPLPGGTRLTMRYTYDNSAGNPANPNSPPLRVRWGTDSADEMATLMLQVLPPSSEDGARVIALFRERELLETIEMAEARVAEDADSAGARALLGRGYGEAGRFADAIPHLEAAIRLGDADAATFSALGFALAAAGRLDEAVTRFARAAALDPLNEVIHYNQANALDRLARFADAETAYERALTLNPDFAAAHANLGISLYSRGRVDAAIPHFERAAALQPDSARFHFNLGNALAVRGEYAEAAGHFERALELEPEFQPAREALERLERIGVQ